MKRVMLDDEIIISRARNSKTRITIYKRRFRLPAHSMNKQSFSLGY